MHKDFVKGMKVKIISINYTENSLNAGETMKNMVGKLFRVELCDDYKTCSEREYCVSINGWCWHHKDIRPVGKKISIPKPQLFDVEKLVV